MKRFALMFNQIGSRLRLLPFLKDEFDWILFTRDVKKLNKYELIYIYAMAGAHEHLYKGYCKQWWQYPIYLREQGVTQPKILFQIDSNGYSFDRFPHPQLLPYIDGILHVGVRNWEINKPYFYVEYPLAVDKSKNKWVDFEDKENAAVIVKRHASMFYPSERIAEHLEIPLHCLGADIKRKQGDDYLEYLAQHKIGLDAHDHYFSWSKFVAECAYMGTPVLALPTIKAATIANPLLVGTEEELMKLGRRLLVNKDFYEECRLTAFKNIDEHLSIETCTERYKYAIRSIGIEV